MRGWSEERGPSEGSAGAAVLELDPVTITSVGGGCARAATVGEESDVVETVAAQCSGDNGVEVLPVTTALPHLDRTRIKNCRWGKWRRRTSSYVPRLLTSPFYSVVYQGPSNHCWVGRPRSGRGIKPDRPLSLLVRRSKPNMLIQGRFAVCKLFPRTLKSYFARKPPVAEWSCDDWLLVHADCRPSSCQAQQVDVDPGRTPIRPLAERRSSWCPGPRFAR
jgi:hypothetical protein